MGAPNLRHDPSSRYAAFVVPEDRLLPAVCPQCGAAGSVPVPVPTDHPERRLHVHLCDLCAGHAARRATLRFAWFTAVVVVCMSMASAMTFIWGERGRLIQFVVLALIALLLGQFAHARSNAAVLRLKLSWARLRPDLPQQPLLLSASPWLNQALIRLEFAQVAPGDRGVARHALTTSAWARLGPFVPALLSGAWWLALEGFSRASIYVVNMGPGPVVLLVDDRHQGTVAATRFEQPNLGYRHELLAGARSVRLLSSAGEAVYSNEQRLLPGQTLLIVRLLPESCVWEERLDYEHPGSPSSWSILARSSQVVLLDQMVDAWFTPLGDGSDQPPQSLTPGAETAPGTRVAVRLLPCPPP